jgi:indolepyruvate ferredoxin oxidoreductase
VQGQVNITFLLLFNGVVALTGGQNPGGQRPVPEVVQELLGLGVRRVGIVSEEPGRYRGMGRDRVEVYSMEDHAQALARFKELEGTTALILDKECATEKARRRRRKGLRPDKYILIHEEICEGCGDCYVQSEGCAALYSVQTEFGEKTQIRQANCVQDELCVDGECPSFVEVRPKKGARLRRREPEPLDELPAAPPCSLEGTYTIFAVGRGGTGVVTIAHLLAYAAMLEGKWVYLSNNTGLAQKGGPVEAPIVLSQGEPLVFNRLFPGQVDLYLGFDLLRAAEADNLKYLSPEKSQALVSTAKVPSAAMNRHPQTQKFPQGERLRELIDGCTRKGANLYLDTYWLAERLFADILFANMLLLGAAHQAGAIPLQAESIEQAIRLNGKAVENNVQAFRWGRLAVADPARVERALGKKERTPEEVIAANRQQLKARPAHLALHEEALGSVGLDAEGQKMLSVRILELGAYQDVEYARQYCQVVRRAWEVERDFGGRGGRLTRAVIFNLYKLMAYKDEYEVARLATRAEAEERIRQLFEGEVAISHRLHPPTLRWLFAKKASFGPWFRPVLKGLARLRSLRGTALDPFGRTPARRLERELVGWYRRLVEEVLERVDEDTYGQAEQLLRLPERIRGYEGIKERAAAEARKEAQRLLAQLG